MKDKLIAWGVQAYTALGLVIGFLALRALLQADIRGAFLWLALSTFIDGTDGPLARRFRTPQILPDFNGRKLDDIVDYVNYVFIPVLILVLALALLVFTPIKHIDPFKTKPLAWLTRPLTVAWAASVLALIVLMPKVNRLLLHASFIYPCYYFIASFWINASLHKVSTQNQPQANRD